MGNYCSTATAGPACTLLYSDIWVPSPTTEIQLEMKKFWDLAHIRPLEHVSLPPDYLQRRLIHSLEKSGNCGRSEAEYCVKSIVVEKYCGRKIFWEKSIMGGVRLIMKRTCS